MKKVIKDSNRITKDYDNINNKDNIFIHTAENVLSTNLWNKNKSQKKPRSGNIEYNGIEICTIVRCFAFKYFLLTHGQNLSLAQ